MFKRKTWSIALSAVLIVSLLLSGCSRKADNAGTSTNDGVEKKRQHLKISLMTPLSDAYPPQRGQVWKLIEEKFDIDYDINAVPFTSYNDKLSVIMASREYPDAFMWGNYDTQFISYAKQGAFMKLEDIVKKYPNLMKTPERTFDNVKVDNVLYAIPRPRPSARTTVTIRKDWLDELGLKIPKTVEEFADVAVKFATLDPDKNGKNDTIGISMCSSGGSLDRLGSLMMAFDTGNGWRVNEDGTLTNTDITPGMKAMLGWLADVYKRGGIDKDFAITNSKQADEKIYAGKVGMNLEDMIHAIVTEEENLAKTDPKGKLIHIDPPVGPKGKSGIKAESGYANFWVIPEKQTKEKVDRIMEILDWMASDEGYQMKRFGIEGVHSAKGPDGRLVTNTKFNEEGIDAIIPQDPYDKYRHVSRKVSLERAQSMMKEYDAIEKFGVYNPFLGFNSDTLAEKGGDLTKLRNEVFIKIVIGQLPLDAFDKYVEDYLKAGGKKIQEEINEAYKKIQKK